MTELRFTVERADGTRLDVAMRGAASATTSDLCDRLAGLGLHESTWSIDGRRIELGNEPLLTAGLRNGSVVQATRRADRAPGGRAVVALTGANTGAFAVLRPGASVTIGRSTGCDLAIDDVTLSGRHVAVSCSHEGEVVLEDLGSRNGTLVEGAAVATPVGIDASEHFAAGASTFAVVDIDATSIPVLSAAPEAATPFPRRFRPAETELPTSIRPPKAPGTDDEGAQRSLVAYVIPIISAVGIAAITGRWIFLAVLALAPIFYAIDGLRRRRRRRRMRAEADAAFSLERDRFVAEVVAARTAERDRDRARAGAPGVRSVVATTRSEDLWERSPDDDDFAELTIGLAERRSSIDASGSDPGDDTPLAVHWALPVCHRLTSAGSLGVVGGSDRRGVGRSLAIDLASNHSPNELELWVFCADDSVDAWEALRWLPHVVALSATPRFFASDAARREGLRHLQAVIASRQDDVGHALPVIVALIDGTELLDADDLSRVLRDGRTAGVAGIVLDPARVPDGVGGLVALGDHLDEASFVSNEVPRTDAVSVGSMRRCVAERAARSLAGLRPAAATRSPELGACALVELLDASTEDQIASVIARRWVRPTLDVPVGRRGSDAMTIDLVRHGPHGLVAGTTRSGKTEFLKTLITSLAANNHPDDLSIVIIDFKGGVDHELSARLHHVVDLSTNHDVASFSRTVELLESELRRRQAIFRDAGAPNQEAYHALRSTRPDLEPVPRLLVIIDEFSELLANEAGKARLAALESITRVGGGLGVHLLLVTQNFENQLPSQIAANAGLRICFRVQAAGHSKIVLDAPAAASISPRHVGRAMLRAHGGDVVEFQTARVAGARRDRASMAEAELRLDPITAAWAQDAPLATADVPADDTDMWMLIEAANSAAERSGWTAPAVPWPGALPASVSLETILRRTDDELGPSNELAAFVVDEPDRQRQGVAPLPATGHVLLAGGSRAALAPVARTVGIGHCVGASPVERQLYVIDQMGAGLGPLGALPHCGGVAERDDVLALRIIRHLADVVSHRRADFARVGVGDIDEWAGRNHPELARVLLLIHGVDRLLLAGEGASSPLLGPLLALQAESAGTGVRLLLVGAPSVSHHRLGAGIAHRFVFECDDRQELGALGVPRDVHGAVAGPGRAFDTTGGRMVQFATSLDGDVGDLGDALSTFAANFATAGSSVAGGPQRLRQLPWPLVWDMTGESAPPDLDQPVPVAAKTDSGEVAWLDAEEDGPVFVVCGPPKSGRSSALLSIAANAARHGWHVVGSAPSKRSPLHGWGEMPTVSLEALDGYATFDRPVMVVVDDAHKLQSDPAPLARFVDSTCPRAVVLSGPADFFAGRSELLRQLPVLRTALVLRPEGSLDASAFGVRRLSDDQCRDHRAGVGVLVASGETQSVQVPVAA